MYLSRRMFVGGCVTSLLLPTQQPSAAAKTFGARDKIVVGDENSPPITVYTVAFPPGPRFINIHENENTSLTAAIEIVPKKGGLLIGLEQRKERNITFRVNKRTYVADPNRMFTKNGVKATLTALSQATPEAERALASFGAHILGKLGRDDTYPVVALHNNTEGSLSIKSYEKDKPFRQGVADIHQNAMHDADDFFLVTEASHFSALKKQGFNVVLENPKAVSDDGSLSVYCGKKGIPYINIEAQHGHGDVQRRMIEAVYAIT